MNSLGDPHGHVENGSVHLAYWTFGRGKPVLLITGLATPAASWLTLPHFLAGAGFRAVVMDNRDCGLSSRCDGLDYAISDMASDAAAVLDALGIESAYLYGISMGGYIAQRFALDHPRRVDRLMLVATGPGVRGETASAETLTRLFEPVQAKDPLDAMKTFLGRLLGPLSADAQDNGLAMVAEARLRWGSEPDAFARQWGAITTFDSLDSIESITAPTLVMHGESDPLVPVRNGELLAERIPGAELIKLPGVGHFVPMEAPLPTVEAINRFFPLNGAQSA